MSKGRREFLRTAACATIGAAFASSFEGFRVVGALAPQAADDYRALVCVFLNGGNDGDNMVVPLDDYASYSAARAADRDSAIIIAAGDVRASAIQTSAALATANPNVATVFPATQLGLQLQQVARVIALRDIFQMRRQIFFCYLTGFDTHFSQRGAGTGTQDSLLGQVSQAMRAFYNATVELGVANGVTTFTLSDFGRTFDPAGLANAVGSDHGWGNIQMIMGGAVRGGDFYDTPPTLALGGPDDADTRGRWIPTTSLEQYAATLATWYGLSAADLPAVFPLINRFATPNMGFMT
jgi:uncharacterized protein (DUF1501 family)